MEAAELYLSMVGDDLIDLVVFETNRQRIQKAPGVKEITKDDLLKYLGIMMYRSLVKLPSYYYYWRADLKITAVSETMSRNRFSVSYPLLVSLSLSLSLSLPLQLSLSS